MLADFDQFAKDGADADGTAISVFVAQSCGQLIGAAVFRDASKDAPRIRAHYNVEDYILFNQHANHEHGHLHHSLSHCALANC